MTEVFWVEVVGLIALPTLLAIIGLLLRIIGGLKAKIDAQSDRIGKLELHVAENYVKKGDMKEMMADLKQAFRDGLADVDKKIDVLFDKVNDMSKVKQ